MSIYKRFKQFILHNVGRRFSFFSKSKPKSGIILGSTTKITGKGDCIEARNERHESWTIYHSGDESDTRSANLSSETL